MVTTNAIPLFTDSTFDERTARLAIIRDLIRRMNEDLAEMEKYRNYYDGEQEIVYGTDKFKSEVVVSYPGLKENWCEVVVDAPADKLKLEKIVFLKEKSEGGEGAGGAGGADGVGSSVDPTEDPIDKPLTNAVWKAFRDNDIDEQQDEIHTGALIEGRSAMIVWPDTELGARIDWQPAQNIYVRYADDDWRKPIAALKRWRVDSGEVYLTLYTPNFIYKYKEVNAMTQPVPLSDYRKKTIPAASANTALEERRPEGEEWPLPNPFGSVPVIEFPAPRGSKLKDAIPIQDALNYLLLLNLYAGENVGFKQRVFFTHAKEPTGGWENSPGKVWRIPPYVDAEGKMTQGSAFEFTATSLDQFKNSIEMLLQHLAFTTKTPMRMFFNSDRGGRGDAPSGDSQLVSDDAMIEDIDKMQSRFGNSWYRVALLVARAMNLLELGDRRTGEAVWVDHRARYKTALMEEAKSMADIGIPIKFIVTKMGLSIDEQATLIAMIEQQNAELERKEAEMVEAQANQATDPIQSNSPATPPTSV